ncbi:hypothetical protein GCM10010124_37050 [Pilimelia terevasa]|uniref:PPM-type phosphatase domain-containing protein n=1 Tax=Pilimelia terevasa TaxID=53372 RepID=A0A8J3FLC5_9ACTN|nr:protein phosphatase 2C domain-containing protein [Pilimelia terevasa]GGK40790.1 hypothetical protein GCM10010124_37050 [Pilimelia terevasa]
MSMWPKERRGLPGPRGRHDHGGDYQAVVAAVPADSQVVPEIRNRPRPGQWDPIVVDQPAFPVEALPSAAQDYPDTICDGWATPHLVVRMASARGDAHRHRGQPRQDHALIAVHPRTGALLLAVLDGVSAVPLAHVGAQAAGRAALAALWSTLNHNDTVDWEEVVGAAARALLRHHQYGIVQGESRDDVERRLATTIVAGLVRPTPDGLLATLVRVGDSGAWLLDRGSYLPLFAAKGAGEATISGAVDPLPRMPEHVRPIEVPVPRDGVLLVATDGIGDPLGDGTGLVGQLFAEVLVTPPPLLGFAHAVDFSRDTFDDDRTLVAVWPR